MKAKLWRMRRCSSSAAFDLGQFRAKMLALICQKTCTFVSFSRFLAAGSELLIEYFLHSDFILKGLRVARGSKCPESCIFPVFGAFWGLTRKWSESQGLGNRNQGIDRGREIGESHPSRQEQERREGWGTRLLLRTPEPMSQTRDMGHPATGAIPNEISLKRSP